MTPDGDNSPATLRSLHDQGHLDLPLPGGGRTAHRHRALIELAQHHGVGVARLAEAHVDAVAILHEAGQSPRPDALYGVWASSSPDGGPAMVGGRITGTKRFCSGLGIVDRALMLVSTDAGERLVDVDARSGATICFDTSAWSTVALADTATGDITYVDHPVDQPDTPETLSKPESLVGSPGWYLDRPGFWHGACGPAACWAGAALGLVDAAGVLVDADPHRRAHVGAMEATRWTLLTLFDGAGGQIDADPDDCGAAERRARAIRHTTERLCSDVLDRFGRAFGPRPFVGEKNIAQRAADLHLYLRQHHAERELGELARRPDIDA